MSRSSIRRVPLVVIILFAATAALLALSALARKSAEDKGVIPAAVTVSASLTDNVAAGSKVAPGSTINYTATITLGGVSPADDATNVNFSAPLDPNTTIVAGSVHASPIAFNNAYTTVGNTLLEVGVVASGNPAVTAAGSLFDNDIIPTSDTIQLQSFQNPSANNGTVSVDSAGHFSYLPPVGFTGTDTFTYTIRNSADNTLQNTGIVTITVNSPRVWYVNNSGANGDGRSTSPFNTLANAAAVDAANDIIYIFTGTGNYTGGITLLNGEQVIGNGVALVVNTFTLRAAGSRPTVVNGAGNGITLASANTLSGFNFGNCTGGFAFQGVAVGTLAVNNMLISTNGGAFDITAGGSSVNVVLDSTTSSGGTKNVNIATANGTVTLGSGALSGASGNAFDVTGAGTAGITFSGTITNVAAARVVNISGKTGGTVALSGLVTGTTASTGINLSSNTGATINFTGGVNLNAPTAGFAATGPGPAATSGGTVNVTDPNALGTAPDNTIVTTTGTALNVTHTTIGASGLNFRSISANGAPNGIFLNNTGVSGSLIVTGDGTNTTKGGNASGGTIQNINGADATTNGIAIYLNNTSGPQLRRITVSGTIQNQGVYGELVNNLTMQYCTIGGTIGTTSGSNDLNLECPVEFGKTAPAQVNGFAGGSSSTVDNCLISGGIQHNMEVYQQANTASLTISNSNITNNGAALGSDGINIETHTDGNGGTPFAQLTVSVQGCLFDNDKSQALQANALGDSFLNLTINNSTVQKTTQGNEGFVLQNGGDADMTVHVTNNSFTGILGTNILVGQVVGNASNLSNLIGVIQSNTMTVGNATTFPTNRTLIVFFSSTVGLVSTANVLVNANTINTFSDPVNGLSEPLFVSTPDANTDPSFTATVTNNIVNITDTTGLSLRGIAIQSTQNVSAGCIDVRSNDVNYAPVTPAGIAGIRVRQTAPATLQMEQGVSAGAAATVLAANNPLSTTEVVGTVTVVSNSTCQTAPSAPSMAGGNNIAVNSGVTGEMFYIASVEEAAKTDNSHRQFENQPTGSRSVLARVIYGTTRALGRLVNRVDDLISPTVYADDKVITPSAGETVTLNTIATFPAGKSITIKYSATVNTSALTARQASTQGTVSGSNFASKMTDDPEPGGATDPTVTLLDTTLTWTGATSTDWNDATNWNRPGPAVSSYAPGVTNPAVNDVVIPSVVNQPNIGAAMGDVNIFSLNLASGMTLTITNPRILTIGGGGTGSDLTLNGSMSGGELRFVTGTHNINVGVGGNLSATNLARVISGSTTLNNDLPAGAFAVDAGGTLNITNRILTLRGAGTPLTVGGTFTLTGSRIVYNSTTGAQTAAALTYNNLTIDNSAGVNLAGATAVNGNLTFTNGNIITGANTLTLGSAGTITRTSGHVVGTLKKNAVPNGAFTFTVGTATGYTPLVLANASGGGDLTVTTTATAHPVLDAAHSLQEYWTLTEGGTVTADLTFNYLDANVVGNEATYRLIRIIGGTAGSFQNSVNTATNTASLTGVSNFSDWTVGEPVAPTASNGVITGRIVDNNGNAVEGAVIRLEGTQNRKFITDANGFYRFDNVETNGFYTVTPSRANYAFSPAQRSFSLLGETTQAAFGATLDSGNNLLNPLDTPEYFVRQHYVDFLGREPDEAGFNYWSDQIIGCGLDQDCIGRKRENVSAAYFLSIEFQATGGLVDGLYRASYGVRPAFGQFMTDTRSVAQGVIVGQAGWETKLLANKQAFVDAFVNQPAFHAIYDNMDNSLFVDTLISHTGVTFSPAERDTLVSGLAGGSLTRADALRSIAENQRFVEAKFNQAFVMMEYFGYLRRDPDADGYQFWLNKLNQYGGNFEQAEMVKAFITSIEYRQRFPR